MKLEHHKITHEYEIGHWWYRVRREIVHDIISKNCSQTANLRIADIGCGGGALAKEMEHYGVCTGVDPSQESLDSCRKRGLSDVVLGTAENTGLPDNAYDVVTCLDVLEHLEKEDGAIAEIHRILKVGGVGIVFVPAFMFLWGTTDVSSHHYRRYRLPEIVEKLEGVDFEILKKSYFNTLLFPLIAFFRISVRILSINVDSEVSMGNSFTNEILYQIFSFERRLLRHTNLPFGVSAMVIVRKK